MRAPTRRRLVLLVLSLPLAGLVGTAAFLLVVGMPHVAAGMVAHAVCSGRFVAGRELRQVLEDDVLAASFLFRLVEVSVDEVARSAGAVLPDGSRQLARHLGARGCVLDAVPQAGAAPAAAAPASAPAAAAQRWPLGEAPWPTAEWGPDVDAARLLAVADRTMDPAQAHSRAFAVVHRGRMLLHRHAPGFDASTPMHGWSMGKTVLAMLAHQAEAEHGLAFDRPVVEAFRGGREPAWVRDWRADDRRAITVADLVHMRDGLDHVEFYMPGSDVLRMLFGEPDVAGFAARATAAAPPGQRWRYSSFSSNLLAGVLRGRFDSDQAYWDFPSKALFGPIGATGAMFESDRDGNWIASSYLWARSGDWARLGQLTLDDGRWAGRAVLAPGWLARVSTPSVERGRGRGYGAQAWRLGDREAGGCREAGVPEDTLAMTGHWGQIVAMVPSRQLVIVRLGWARGAGAFDSCRLIADVLQAFPPAATAAAASLR